MAYQDEAVCLDQVEVEVMSLVEAAKAYHLAEDKVPGLARTVAVDKQCCSAS